MYVRILKAACDSFIFFSYFFSYDVKVILESLSSMSHAQQQRSIDKTSPQVLVLSAKNGKSLQNAIGRIKEYTARAPCPVNDLAYTLGIRREHLSHRAFAIIDPDGTISDFEKSRDITYGITFVFTGQGAQWVGMGKELMSASPRFLSSIRAMDKELSLLINPPSWTLEGKIPYTSVSTRSDLTILSIQKSLRKMKNQAGFSSLNLPSRSPLQCKLHWSIFLKNGVCVQHQS